MRQSDLKTGCCKSVSHSPKIVTANWRKPDEDAVGQDHRGPQTQKSQRQRGQSFRFSLQLVRPRRALREGQQGVAYLTVSDGVLDRYVTTLQSSQKTIRARGQCFHSTTLPRKQRERDHGVEGLLHSLSAVSVFWVIIHVLRSMRSHNLFFGPFQATIKHLFWKKRKERKEIPAIKNCEFGGCLFPPCVPADKRSWHSSRHFHVSEGRVCTKARARLWGVVRGREGRGGEVSGAQSGIRCSKWLHKPQKWKWRLTNLIS